jgi:hypothetical protein
MTHAVARYKRLGILVLFLFRQSPSFGLNRLLAKQIMQFKNYTAFLKQKSLLKVDAHIILAFFSFWQN